MVNNIVLDTNCLIASLNSPFVRLVDPYFRFNLIQSDVDDNKFVDCAIAANAVFIVSEDTHFNVLKEIAFPCVNVIRLERFLQILKNQYYSITDTPTSFLNEEQ